MLEVACFNKESCLLAQQAGADRIEFCADYQSGGVTPNYEDIINVRDALKIPLHVIIRPRGGNFIYNENEFSKMQQDVLFCKSIGVNGVVFGILDAHNNIDVVKSKALLELALPINCTFHRAIDVCSNIDIALLQLIEMGFSRVLTSGGKGIVTDNLDKLSDLQKNFGQQIIIMPGGAIRHSNILSIISKTHCAEFHTSALDLNKKISKTEIVKMKTIFNIKLS